MDSRETYGHAGLGMLIALYFPPELDPPQTILMRPAATSDEVEFVRLAASSLHCDPVPGITGQCGSYECHRRQLGACQCGSHKPAPRPVRAEPLLSASSSKARPGRPDS